MFRTQTGNLDLIVNMYNGILSTLLPVEKPLLAARIDKMNAALRPGIEELTWSSKNIDAVISQCMGLVRDADELVKKMKENVRKMQRFMQNWATNPLFARKNKPAPPDELEQTHQSIVMARLQDIKDNGKEIQKLLKDTVDHILPVKKSPEWIAYQDYLNGLIIEGIAEAIVASMNHLATQIDTHQNKLNQWAPMFDVQVDLVDREVVFNPPIESTAKGTGIRDILMRIIGDFVSISIQMPRLDSGTGDYLAEINDRFDILHAMSAVTSHLHEIHEQTVGFLQQYEEFSFLWKRELEESFEEFLNKGQDLGDTVKKSANDDADEEAD